MTTRAPAVLTNENPSTNKLSRAINYPMTIITLQRQLALCLRSGGQQQGGRARRELELQCVTTIALVRWRRATSATTLNKL